MDLPSATIIELLNYLLPGLITAATLYNLTPSPKPTPFERIVQALIFTLIVQVIVVVLRSSLLFGGRHFRVLGIWTDNVRLGWSVVVAIALGLLLAYWSNHDSLHSHLRKLGITLQTSYSSEWFGVLAQNRGYIVLHMVGERRLYGWPTEWPNTPDSGHFVISLAEWLDGDKRIPVTGVDRMLIRATDVEMIEFMALMPPASKETNHG